MLHGPDGVVETDQTEIAAAGTNQRLFERLSSTGERYTEHQFADGFYRMADPRYGSAKHHAANQVRVLRSEISVYLSKGFHLRMRGEIGGQVNLVAPSKIRAIANQFSDSAPVGSLSSGIEEPNGQKMG